MRSPGVLGSGGLPAALQLLVAAAVLCSLAGAALAVTPFERTWTTTEDFLEGKSVSMRAQDDALVISDTQAEYNYIWIPCSSTNTMLKINTDFEPTVAPPPEGTTLPIMSRFQTGPNPSRTTVDPNGNVWVGHRDLTNGRASLQRVGLVENDNCKDFDGDGAITTSARGTGTIGEGTFPPLVTGGVGDECVTHVFVDESQQLQDVRTMAIDASNRVWIGSYYSKAHLAFLPQPLSDSPTGGAARLSGTVKVPPMMCGIDGTMCGGYGGVINSKGVLYSSDINYGVITRIDTVAQACVPGIVVPGHSVYGLGIDRHNMTDPEDDVVVAGTWGTNSVWAESCPDILAPGSCPGARGITVDNNHDIWVACSLATYVNKYRLNPEPHGQCGVQNYTLLGSVEVGSGPTGLAVDGNGKVWVSVMYANLAQRINPDPNGIGAIDLTVRLPDGCYPYTYGDLTGSVRTKAPDMGSWSTVYDSGLAGNDWSRVTLSWHADIPAAPAGTGRRLLDDDVPASIVVSVSTSADGLIWSAPVTVVSGAQLTGVPAGQYLRLKILFNRSTAGASPTLLDITLSSQECDPALAEGCCDAQGAFLPADTACRAAAGDCQLASVCNGTSSVCPPNALLPPGTPCGNITGLCQERNTCNGVNATCPTTVVLKKRGSVCRPAEGACDVADECSGDSPFCGFSRAHECHHHKRDRCGRDDGWCDDHRSSKRSQHGVDDQDWDRVKPKGSLCRALNTSNPCDVAEVCDGKSKECPADGFKRDGAPCAWRYPEGRYRDCMRDRSPGRCERTVFRTTTEATKRANSGKFTWRACGGVCSTGVCVIVMPTKWCCYVGTSWLNEARCWV